MKQEKKHEVKVELKEEIRVWKQRSVKLEDKINKKQINGVAGGDQREEQRMKATREMILAA